MGKRSQGEYWVHGRGVLQFNRLTALSEAEEQYAPTDDWA